MPVIDGLPIPEALRQVPPRAARPGTEEDPVDHRPVIGPPAALPRIGGQERPQPLPLLISQVMAFQSLKHRTDLQHQASKIHGTRPRCREGGWCCRATGRAPREATWDRRREWAGPVLLRGRHYACSGGRVPHQLPRGVSGAFVDVSRARNSPRHSPSYRLTTVIVGTENMCVQATSAGRASVPNWCRLSLDTRVTGITDTPSRRSS